MQAQIAQEKAAQTTALPAIEAPAAEAAPAVESTPSEPAPVLAPAAAPVLGTAVTVQAQDAAFASRPAAAARESASIATARELYASARYEEALALLNNLRPSDLADPREVRTREAQLHEHRRELRDRELRDGLARGAVDPSRPLEVQQDADDARGVEHVHRGAGPASSLEYAVTAAASVPSS